MAQGSILDPFLFLLYIKGSKQFCLCLPQLFADHTCFLIDSQNLASLETEMNKDLTNVCKGCIADELSLNPPKSNHLIIPAKRNIRSSCFTLFIYNLPILSCDKAKYLGVFIDSHLNLLLTKKVLKIRLLCRWHSFKIEAFSSFYFSFQTILSLYSSPFVAWFIRLGFYPQILFIKITNTSKQSCKNHWRPQIYGPCYTILL